MPLARALNIQVHSQFQPEQYLEMVNFVRENPAFNGKVLVIAWEHHAIPALVRALGVNPEPPEMAWTNLRPPLGSDLSARRGGPIRRPPATPAIWRLMLLMTTSQWAAITDNAVPICPHF